MLGAGRSGTVYRAFDRLTHDDVALKVCETQVGDDPSSPQFLHERKLQNQINDFTHVVRILDLHVTLWGGSKLLLLVMEYGEGGNLRSWIERHRADSNARLTRGVDLIRQACAAVGTLNDAGVVPIDIKPENMVLSNGVLKILDLAGSVCSRSDLFAGLGLQMQELANSSTPEYASPELFDRGDGAHLDPRSNVYSLGVMLYELIHPACKRPFDGSYEELKRLHAECPPPRLDSAQPELTAIVSGCLAKAPEERFASAWELLDALSPASPTCEPTVEEAPPTGDQTHTEEEAACLWEMACGAMSDGRLGEAIQACGELLLRFPDHAGAREMAEEIRLRKRRAEALYEQLRERMHSMGFAEIRARMVEGEQTYPGHSLAEPIETLFSGRAEEYCASVDHGLSALRDAAWDRAQPFLRRASSLNPGAPDVEVLLAFVSEVIETRNRLKADMEAAFNAGDMARALTTAAQLDDYLEEKEARVHTLC